MTFQSTAYQITLLFISILHICKGIGLRVNDSEEYKLRREILESMDVMVRPVKSYADPVNVSFSLVVRSLKDLDNERQVSLTSVWISQRWHNPFLEWDNDKHGGIDRIHVSPFEIWVPDIILYNNGIKQVLQAGHTEFFKNWVVLHSNGTCTWDSPSNIESGCDIDISSFPFDKQNCSLFFGSATYGSELLRIHSMQPKGRGKSQGDADNNGEWLIDETYEEIFTKQRQPNSEQKYSFIKYTLQIQRKWVYYIMFLILPCVICTILVLSSFSIPPENGERIGFCSTILVAVSVFLLLIEDILPEKSDTLPILGVYYTITMLEIAGALMATIIVLRAYHATSEPPAYVKALYRKCKTKKRKIPKTAGSELTLNIKKLLKRNNVASELTPVDTNRAAILSPRPGQERKPIVGNDVESSGEENKTLYSMWMAKRETNIPSTSGSEIRMEKILKRDIVASELTPNDANTQAVSTPRPVPEHTPNEVNSVESNEEENKKVWRATALCFDHFFFYLFLLIFFGSTVYLIKHRPVFKLHADGSSFEMSSEHAKN